MYIKKNWLKYSITQQPQEIKSKMLHVFCTFDYTGFFKNNGLGNEVSAPKMTDCHR